MGKSILFISDISNSFFLNSIITTLEKNNFDCDFMDFDPAHIQTIHRSVDAYFLFVGADAVTRNSGALLYINNYCVQNHRKLFMLGNQEDIDDCMNIIDESVIWTTFARPVNAGDVSNSIMKSFDDMIKNDNRKTILLVDDSGTVLHTMKQWLEPTYKVQMLNSAANALVYLGKHRPDLILLDYEMPVCDGPQMLGMLRADPDLANLPVMFLTSKGDRESIEKVLALHPQGYLLKTLPKEKIHEALANFFAGK